ncbi:hypothetical protein MNBD_PLANCTO03-973 [hydrothermal vent metagenome]|uniref:Type IV pilus biogenesis protein PilE n=1 Tax=hydrothermal vent metagenome TaxID=652676 RepID=A0A3B1E5V5_9ZZZZ
MKIRGRNTGVVRSAFTLIELIAVIVVLAILAGVAVPKYFDYSTKAKESAAKATLGATRSAMANFYANEALTNGSAAYPTLTDIQTVGTVLEQPLPANPYNNSNTIQASTWNAAAPPVSGTAGWNYDAAAGRFWANTDTAGIDENEW